MQPDCQVAPKTIRGYNRLAITGFYLSACVHIKDKRCGFINTEMTASYRKLLRLTEVYFGVPRLSIN